MSETFSERLRAWMKRHDLGRREASEILETSYTSIKRYEQGDEPKGRNHDRIVRAMERHDTQSMSKPPTSPKPSASPEPSERAEPPNEDWIESTVDIPPGASFHITPPMGSRPGVVAIRYPSTPDDDD